MEFQHEKVLFECFLDFAEVGRLLFDRFSTRVQSPGDGGGGVISSSRGETSGVKLNNAMVQLDMFSIMATLWAHYGHLMGSAFDSSRSVFGVSKCIALSSVFVRGFYVHFFTVKDWYKN